MSQEAIEAKADLVLLPEAFNFRGDIRNKEAFSTATEKIPGPSCEVFMSLAKKRGVFFLLGSLLERGPKGRAYNTSVLVDDKGRIAAKYRKIHLFRANLGENVFKESQFTLAGSKGAAATIGDFGIGLSICYDLRFPGLYQSYSRKGLEILTIPACFTRKTGEAHWETLLRARAIENLAYVLAPGQVGTDSRGIQAHGNSMVISPWGEVISRAGADTQEIIFAEIALEEIRKARWMLPGIIKKDKSYA
jgi:predicted amidohydrolase